MKEQQPYGQRSHNYRYRATASVSRTVVRREEASQTRSRNARRTPEQTSRSVLSERKVTMPHEAIQPLSWAERQARFRVRPTAQTTRGRMVPRTLSQTGHAAPAGTMRARRPLPPSQHTLSPIPVRSGQRKRQRTFWRRLFGFMALLALVSAGVIFALVSPIFHVQHMQVSGTRNQALIAAIEHMGIQGQDIFLLNQAAVLRQINALPLVASANVRIQLPNDVTVAIQERVPALLWQNGTTTFSVAQDGTIIALFSPSSTSSQLPRVLDKRTTRLHPGQRFDAADIAFAQHVLQQLPGVQGMPPFTLQYIDHIMVGTRSIAANQAGRGSYVALSSQGWSVYLGDASNSTSLANRLLALQQVLGIAQTQHLKLATIDVRFGLRPTYTLQS